MEHHQEINSIQFKQTLLVYNNCKHLTANYNHVSALKRKKITSKSDIYLAFLAIQWEKKKEHEPQTNSHIT